MSNITERSIREIAKILGLNLDKISLEDPKVFELFARGDTDAIFQFESPGMQKYLKKLRCFSVFLFKLYLHSLTLC